MVDGLDVVQQVELTLGHGRWTRLLRVCVIVLAGVGVRVALRLDAGAAERVRLRLHLRLGGGVGRLLADVRGFYFLEKRNQELISVRADEICLFSNMSG